MGDVTDMSYGMPPYGGHMEPPNMEELQDFAKLEQEPGMQGRRIVVIFAPK